MVLCLPVALIATLSASTGGPTENEADRNAWLKTLVGPVAGARGAGAAGQLDPQTAVLPSGGDLQVLVITQDGGGEDAIPGIQTGIQTNTAVSGGDTGITSSLTRSGIPVRALTAYVAAAQMMAVQDPSCRIQWSLIAGIGRVESNHGRFGGAGINADGRVSPPILGPRLDGSHAGWATVHDSDRGRYDGDPVFDRAVGPMQFLPGSWKAYARDADGNGTVDPQDLDDAAVAAARYLCSSGGDLSTQQGRWNAVFRYNRSTSYVQLVLGLADSYASGRAAPLPNPLPNPTGPIAEPPATPLQPAPGLQPTPRPAPRTPSPGQTTTPSSPSTTPTPTPTTPTSGGTTPPSGTGTGTTTPTPTDTGTTTPSPADTGTTTPSPADTGTTTPTPTDTGTTTPSPADTGTTTPSPADTGTTTPTPADTGTTTPTPADTTPSTTSATTSDPTTATSTTSATTTADQPSTTSDAPTTSTSTSDTSTSGTTSADPAPTGTTAPP